MGALAPHEGQPQIATRAFVCPSNGWLKSDKGFGRYLTTPQPPLAFQPIKRMGNFSPSRNLTVETFKNGNPRPDQDWDEVEQCFVGRDPRDMTPDELAQFGHSKKPILTVVRRNCLDCTNGSEAEVRRCGLSSCPFWPFRMGTNPFAAEQSEERRLAAAERMRVRNARQKEPA